MKNPVQKTERYYFRLLVWIIGAIVLVTLLGWGGLRAYHAWQERHLVRRAAGFLGGGNLKTAALSARRALQLNPESVEAARMMATIAERAADGTSSRGGGKSTTWHRVRFDDALALVRAALRANDLALAERTLTDNEHNRRKHAGLSRGARPIWLKCGINRRRPKRIGLRASELAPQDPAYQVQLAMIQLGAVDKAKREAALASLDRLRQEPKQRAAATRALLIDGGSRGADPQRMRLLASELQVVSGVSLQRSADLRGDPAATPRPVIRII